MSGNDERVNTWAKLNHDIGVASANIKNPYPECNKPTMKVPNAILCATTGELIKEVKKK